MIIGWLIRQQILEFFKSAMLLGIKLIWKSEPLLISSLNLVLMSNLN